MVSVIIPIYNVEKYLCECIESVTGQSFRNLEIILVDDGSPDSSGEICDEYAERDSRIKVIHKKNGGLSDARNAGMDAANGDYVLFLDGDDYIKRTTVEELYTYAERTKAEIVCFDFEIDLEIASTDMELHKHAVDYKTVIGTEVLISAIDNDDFIPNATSKFYNAGFLKRNNLRFKRGMYYEDVLFNTMAFMCSKKVVFMHKSFYYYRVRENSITTSAPGEKNFKSWLVCARELRKEIANCKEKKKNEALEKSIKYVIIMYLYSYIQISYPERRRRKNDIRYLRSVTEGFRETKCFNLKLKLFFPELYVLYRKTVYSVKERGKHLIMKWGILL